MQGAIFLQKFEEIATFEQKKCLAVYRKRGRFCQGGVANGT